jgi:hypothetical protein
MHTSTPHTHPTNIPMHTPHTPHIHAAYTKHSMYTHPYPRHTPCTYNTHIHYPHRNINTCIRHTHSTQITHNTQAHITSTQHTYHTHVHTTYRHTCCFCKWLTPSDPTGSVTHGISQGSGAPTLSKVNLPTTTRNALSQRPVGVLQGTTTTCIYLFACLSTSPSLPSHKFLLGRDNHISPLTVPYTPSPCTVVPPGL